MLSPTLPVAVGLPEKKQEELQEPCEHGIKLIVFDLDGVLVDSRELHYEALNRALAEIDPKFIIQREEHLAKYDGLPTTAKLNMLTKEKGELLYLYICLNYLIVRPAYKYAQQDLGLETIENV